MSELLVFIAAIGAICGAVGGVMMRTPFYAVLALVFHLLSLAALFLLLEAQFVAAAQVIVYAGAVMVLYVFVVAYVGAAEPSQLRAPVSAGQRALALLFALALFVELSIAVLGSALHALDTEGPTVGAAFGSPEQIGQLFLTKFLLPFEVASFLLLIAFSPEARTAMASSTNSARPKSTAATRCPRPTGARSRAGSAAPT